MSPVHETPLSPPPLPKSVYARKASISAAAAVSAVSATTTTTSSSSINAGVGAGSPPQPTVASSSSSSYSSYTSSSTKSAHQINLTNTPTHTPTHTPTLTPTPTSASTSTSTSTASHHIQNTLSRKRQPLYTENNTTNYHEKRTTPQSPKITPQPPQPRLGPQDLLPSPAPSPVQPSNRNTLTVKQSKPRAVSAPDLDLPKELSSRQYRESTTIELPGVGQIAAHISSNISSDNSINNRYSNNKYTKYNNSNSNTMRLRPSKSLAALKNVVSSEKAKIPAQTLTDTCASCTILRHDLTNQAALTELSQKRMQSMEHTIVELRNTSRESLEHYENTLKSTQQTNVLLTNTIKASKETVSRLQKEREDLRKAGLDAIEVYEATLAELGAISEEKEQILASGRQQNAALEQQKAELVGQLAQANERHAQVLSDAQAEAQAAKTAQVQAEKEAIEARTALETIRFKWEQESHQADKTQVAELNRLRREVEEWKKVAAESQQNLHTQQKLHQQQLEQQKKNKGDDNNMPDVSLDSQTRWLLQAEILDNLSTENKRLHEARRQKTNCHCFVSAISRLQKQGLKCIEEDAELDTSIEWKLQKAVLQLRLLEEEHEKEIRDKQDEIHVLQCDIDELENAIEKNVFKEALTANALENERRVVSRLQAELKDIREQVTFLKGTRRMSSKRWVVSKYLNRTISDDDECGADGDDDNKESYCEICEVSGHDLMTCSVVMQQRPLTPATSVERLCTLPELST
ncbi:hypothetical protein F4703DRAFT_1848129 [Phycomyces blakesleeanus]